MLDNNFIPFIKILNQFKADVKKNDSQPLSICIERNDGYNYIYSLNIFKDDLKKNYPIVERIVKSLIWIVGGYKIYIAGDSIIADKLAYDYSIGGIREFDVLFMEKIYEKKFEILSCDFSYLPKNKTQHLNIGGNYSGNRIGFDAGGSDRKVCAVKNGEILYSEEVLWLPKIHSDPQYHYDEIYEAFKTAALKLDNKVDAIGISSAGVYIDNKIMAASLFKNVNDNLFEKCVKNMYIDISSQFGHIPVVVANDGDVTALAGALQINDNKVLGIAMGTSEAVGYINSNGGINGWLNELAFVPIAFNNNEVDEWSGDYGTGANYLCQEGIIMLAKLIGHNFNDSDDTPAKKLKHIQLSLEKNEDKYLNIYETMGKYLAYSIAYYSEFYDIKHILLLGRVVSGKGGDTLINNARKILLKEFNINYNFFMPDEKNRRLGQSIVAASLPII